MQLKSVHLRGRGFGTACHHSWLRAPPEAQQRRRKQRGNRRTLLWSCVWTVVGASISSFVPNWSETWKMREIEYHLMKLKIIISFTRFQRFWFLHNLVQFHDEINDMYIYIQRVLVFRSRDVLGINLIENCFGWKKQISPPLYCFRSSHLIWSPSWGKTGRFFMFLFLAWRVWHCPNVKFFCHILLNILGQRWLIHISLTLGLKNYEITFIEYSIAFVRAFQLHQNCVAPFH